MASSDDSSSHVPRWERKMNRAKRAHRPKLRDWGKDGFGPGGRREGEFEAFAAQDLPTLQRASGDTHPIDSVDCSNLSVEQFFERYEKRCQPVLIRNVPAEERWRALENWTFDKLLSKYRDYKMKCGEDDDGYSVKVRMKHFLHYTEAQRDDSPLYVFDSRFDDDNKASALLDDFSVPSYFPDDLFELVGERRRPPYRWFLIGPRRSGTSTHIDPLATSAWNTVIKGRKRWFLMPPETEKRFAKGKTVIEEDEDDEPINLFMDLLPRMREVAVKQGLRMYEFIQYPGDTVFIPGGWWHAVVNLDDTLAITQNYCGRNNFDKVWRQARSGRKKMSVKWLRKLKEEHEHLARRAEQLNARDGFVMYGDDRKMEDEEDDKGRQSYRDANRKKDDKRDEERERRKKEARRRRRREQERAAESGEERHTADDQVELESEHEPKRRSKKRQEEGGGGEAVKKKSKKQRRKDSGGGEDSSEGGRQGSFSSRGSRSSRSSTATSSSS